MLGATRQWYLIIILFVAAQAHAQALFSPGALSAPHKDLEGADNCLQCHAAGSRVSIPHCQNCHKEVKASIDAKKGLHGHIPADKIACDNCHHEHLGVDNTLLPWGDNRNDFDHRSTGWSLRGAHAHVKCESCHTTKKKSGGTAWTGLKTACASCHFDEHRGQEKGTCDTCHSEQAWKPAPQFDHDDSDYPLTGKHKAVPCLKCHTTLQDDASSATAKPAPVNMAYAKYQGIPHGACLDCHADPHKGKFGSTCTDCHTTSSWFVVKGGVKKDIEFHQHTRYPLEGQHVNVSCKNCHGPWGSQPAIYRGIKFGACEDCHVDAHEQQMEGTTRKKPPSCDDCHTVHGFTPTLFDVAAHEKTDYPLEGAHAVTACNLCHLNKPALAHKVPAAVREKIHRQGRELLISTTEFSMNKPLQRCDSCHLDAHGGQFARRAAAGCADCHNATSFHKVAFDHDKDSRYPLTGAHLKTACIACHTRGKMPDGAFGVVYKPLGTACDSCHRDVHMGQFADADGQQKCDTCHVTDAFKPAPKFKHNDPNDSRFPLEGKHVPVPCDDCHTLVKVDKRTPVQRFKPLPLGCEGCHEDYHRGALDKVPKWPAGQEKAPCDRCHNASGWLPAIFPEHDTVGFPLKGAHVNAPCTGCHLRNFNTSLNTTCEACHRDAHSGEFGAQCNACHTEQNWESTYTVEQHRMNNFPLTGAHGAIPCQECHISFFSRDFRGTTVECIGCHEGDYLRAGTVAVNHVSSNFSTNCRECHDPWAFQRARLADHVNCLDIYNGAHANIYCLDCHTTLVGAVDTGSCDGAPTPLCTNCHNHSEAISDPQHTGIANYTYNNAACLSCHPKGT